MLDRVLAGHVRSGLKAAYCPPIELARLGEVFLGPLQQRSGRYNVLGENFHIRLNFFVDLAE